MFFQSIHQMIAAGTDLSINIKRGDNKLTVAVMPKRANLKAEAQQLMVPLILSGSPEELDAEFLRAIATPIQKAQGILTNLETFEKQAHQAASQSKAAKSATEKESKEVREKREKMEKLLKKAEEAATGNRHSEAMTWLKQAKVLAVPEKQKEIDVKMEEVRKKLSEGSLFGEETAPLPMEAPQAQPVQAAYPQQPAQQQQPVYRNPVQPKPGEQIPMFMEEPIPAPQPVRIPQPAPVQPQAQPPMQQPIQPQVQQQWRQQQPSMMPQAGYIPEPQPQAYNPQWQQPVNDPSGRQYAGQPQMYVAQLQGQMPQNGQQMNGMPINGQGWPQSVPQQPQAPVMQVTSNNNGGREYHSQPQNAEPGCFDKDDESDREFLKEDPYAEYLDFPMECRMKDEAQMELVYC